MKQKMRNRKVVSSHCVKKSSNLLLGFARSENSDLFLYFVHAFPYKTDKSIARSTNFSKFPYFAYNSGRDKNPLARYETCARGGLVLKWRR